MEINLKTVVAQLSIPADIRPLTCIKFNKNRTRIATGARTGYCKIWDIKGKCYATLKAHTDRISDLIWNPNPKQNLSFITGGCDMNIHLWSKNRDKIAVFPVEHTNRNSKMVWHPFINVCFSTSFDKTWCMWDIETTQAVLKQPGHENSVYSIALHPDGGLCATRQKYLLLIHIKNQL
jgi:U4/U6 small nuclear ribonucleoprotein PRP4